MDFDQLRALCAAAEAGSLTTAARHLEVSQPSVSRRVQRLETDVGVALLHRRGNGVALTSAGKRFYEFAVKTLLDYQRVRREMQGQDSVAGAVRIIASTTPGEHLLPMLVSRFAELHPEVTAEVDVTDSAGVAQALVARRADVGFTGWPATERGLHHAPIARDEIVLAVPAAHRLAGCETVPLAELSGERLIQREEGSGTQRAFLDALAGRGESSPFKESPVSLGSTQAVVSAVDAGLGVGLVSLRALQHHPSGSASAVRIEGPPVLRWLYLVYETARARSSAVAEFIAFVVADAVRRGEAPPPGEAT